MQRAASGRADVWTAVAAALRGSHIFSPAIADAESRASSLSCCTEPTFRIRLDRRTNPASRFSIVPMLRRADRAPISANEEPVHAISSRTLDRDRGPRPACRYLRRLPMQWLGFKASQAAMPGRGETGSQSTPQDRTITNLGRLAEKIGNAPPRR